ncbi:MAG: NUDIX domain-containing protein [bacterium]|nr:NUDIX domain-containing protein [bacterium]
MAEELIDIYNQDNEPTGLLELKSKAHEKGLWHRASHIWIYNSKGEILLQLRAKPKKVFPNKWDVSAAGHIAAGEEPVTAAIRETEEELGLKINKEDLEFLMAYKKELISGEIDNKEFYYVYLFRYDGSIASLVLQTEEVDDVDFFPIAKLEEELKSKPEKFVPHGDYWFFMIEKIKKRLTMDLI